MKFVVVVAGLALAGVQSASADAVASFVVTGDAIVRSLTGHAGDPARGEAIVKNRETGNCLICHAIPDPTERFQGEIGPDLTGVGARLSAAQIRLRLVDPTRLDPRAVMPAYHRIEGFHAVDPRFAGRPVLSAAEIEDVVAYLSSLKEAPR